MVVWDYYQMPWEYYYIIMGVQEKLPQRPEREYQKDIEVFQ
jgi:hypothetical protein